MNEKYKILRLFYRTQLRFNEDIIDNTDLSISNELNLKYVSVQRFLQIHLKERFRLFDLKINKL